MIRYVSLNFKSFGDACVLETVRFQWRDFMGLLLLYAWTTFTSYMECAAILYISEYFLNRFVFVQNWLKFMPTDKKIDKHEVLHVVLFSHYAYKNRIIPFYSLFKKVYINWNWLVRNWVIEIARQTY